MGRRTLVNALATTLLLLASAAMASAQDFQKSYNLEPGGTINVANVSGDIHITGYDGSAVTVAGFKEGRDRDLVEVEDLSAAGRVELRVKYPRNCNCDASIRFEVHVPRSTNFNFDRISTASGNIRAEAVSGRIEPPHNLLRLRRRETEEPLSRTDRDTRRGGGRESRPPPSRHSELSSYPSTRAPLTRSLLRRTRSGCKRRRAGLGSQSRGVKA